MFFVLFSSARAEQLRALPDDNLSYPVLYLGSPVDRRHNPGSGFYYQKHNAVYFVTARHVLFSESSVELSALPKTLNVPSHLIYRMQYDFEKKKLIFAGVMSEEDKAELIRSSGNEQLFIRAVEELHKTSQTLHLKDEKGLLFSYSKDRSIDKRNEIELQLAKLLSQGKINYHPQSDIAVVKIGMLKTMESGTKKLSLEDGVRLIRGTGIFGLDASTSVKPFDDVLESNTVFIFGYPTAISNNNAFLDIRLPLLRKGIVAGKNNELKVIILDCPIYQGNSGGLVVEVDEKFPTKYFKGIGLITNFIPFRSESSQESQNSGYSVAVPIDQVWGMLKD